MATDVSQEGDFCPTPQKGTFQQYGGSRSKRTVMEGLPYNVVYAFMLYRSRNILVF
jgi:hypothetical protein